MSRLCKYDQTEPRQESNLKNCGQYLNVNIAGIPILVVSANKNLDLAVDQRYEPFLISGGKEERKGEEKGEGKEKLILKVHTCYPPEYARCKEAFRAEYGSLAKLYGLDSWRVYEVDGEYLIEVTTSEPGNRIFPKRILRLRKDSNVRDMYVSPNYKIDGKTPINPFEYPLDELLLINMVNQHHGVILHSCGVDDNAQGILFCGFSGAGKSTMGNIWAGNGATLINDDQIVVKKENGRFYIHNTPRYGDAPKKTLLTKIFFLNHAAANHVIKLKGSAAVAKLFSCSLPPYYMKNGMESHLNVIKEISEVTPIHELGFAPDSRVVTFVRSID